MSTLLDIIAALSPEEMAAGESIDVITGDGEAFTVTFGEAIPPEPCPFLISSIRPKPSRDRA